MASLPDEDMCGMGLFMPAPSLEEEPVRKRLKMDEMEPQEKLHGFNHHACWC